MDIADESLRSPLGNTSNSEKFDENSGKNNKIWIISLKSLYRCI